MNTWKKRVAAGLAAGMLAFGGSFALQPAPVADAGWGDLIGTVIGGFQAKAEAENQIKELDQTEEGRQALFASYQEELGVEEYSPWGFAAVRWNAFRQASPRAILPSVTSRSFGSSIRTIPSMPFARSVM